MKKIICLLLAVFACAAIVACNETPAPTSSSEISITSTSSSQEDASSEEASSEDSLEESSEEASSEDSLEESSKEESSSSSGNVVKPIQPGGDYEIGGNFGR